MVVTISGFSLGRFVPLIIMAVLGFLDDMKSICFLSLKWQWYIFVFKYSPSRTSITSFTLFDSCQMPYYSFRRLLIVVEITSQLCYMKSYVTSKDIILISAICNWKIIQQLCFDIRKIDVLSEKIIYQSVKNTQNFYFWNL